MDVKRYYERINTLFFYYLSHKLIHHTQCTFGDVTQKRDTRFTTVPAW